MIKKRLALTAAIASASLGFAAQAADPAAGAEKFETCLGCHGVASYTNVYPTYHVPHLGGQNAAYIEAALTAYQNGDRKHPTMQAQSRTLNADDIKNIAAYLESLK